MVLLEMGADPLLPNGRGESPLIVATKRGSIETATVLLDGVVARAVFRCTTERFAKIVKAKAEKEASFGKASSKSRTAAAPEPESPDRKPDAPSATEGDGGAASADAAAAKIDKQKSKRKRADDVRTVDEAGKPVIPVIPRQDVLLDLHVRVLSL